MLFFPLHFLSLVDPPSFKEISLEKMLHIALQIQKP